MKKAQVRKQGFTLIELLVVIAIIAILAAILFPVFISARDKGRQATCLNNGKQLGIAMMMYVSDWVDAYPLLNAQIAFGVNYDGAGHHPMGVFYQLGPYVKGAGVLKCPSSVRYSGNISYLVNSRRTQTEVTLWGLEYGPKPSSYPSRFVWPAAKTGQLRAPSRIVAIMDWHWSTSQGDWTGGMYGDAYGKPTHNGGKNFIFADGHSKWYKTEGISFFTDKAWYYTYEPYKMSWRTDYTP